MIEDLFRAFLIVQPFFWMWVLEDDRFEGLKDVNIHAWFTVSVFAFCVSAFMFDISIGIYSSGYLFMYAILVWLVYSRCFGIFKYSFRDSVALGFLIVYLNSWYWEGVLHLWAIAENGFNLNQAYQMLHLIPAVYFLLRWEFDRQEAGNELMKGWAFAGLISFARMGRIWRFLPIVFTGGIVDFFNQGLMTLNRIICLWYLTNAIIRWGMPRDR